MKVFHIAALLAFGAVCLAGQATAQSAQYGPAYVGAIEAVVDERRVPLERQTAVISMKSKAFGMGGMEMRYEIKGAKSSIRLRHGQTFFFVSRFSQGSVDPQTMFALNVMKTNKKGRMIPQMSVGGYFAVDPIKQKASEYRIALVFEPYKKDFVKITPATALAPGEYFIQSVAGGLDGFAFGID